MITYTFSKEGKMTIFENGAITRDSDYGIVKVETSASQGDSRFKLNMSDPSGALYIIVSKDNLYLYNGLGTGISFIKK
ncbi:hypothetical protein [Algoriphagus sp.]|uniref:hypothetical protein n=1 Tax=Algoriphagus sp. TaxID=1872435 RepID=UPI003F71B493